MVRPAFPPDPGYADWSKIDSSVSRKNSNSVVTSAAYLLFYRRRSEKPLGGPQFERILDSSARISAAAAAEAEEEDQDDELAELAPEAEDDYDSMPSRGMLIGPAPPPKTPFSAYHGTVGNSTLWGGSMPAVKSSEDPGELPGYEDIDGGVTLEEDEGVEIEDPKQLFVGAAGGVLEAEDEGVQEVRLGEERVV